MFMDIADDRHAIEKVDKVLLLTDNVPLAINLLANLVDSVGCSDVLSLWDKEKTALISDGYDRRSNLDMSISLSLSSPRITCISQAQELLSLLSLLPDGLSDVELVQSKLPIDNILACKLALVRTTLAYSDEHKRLKALVPIREYMQKIHPPGENNIRALLKYFQELLELYKDNSPALSSQTIAQISSNYSNIQNILRNGLHRGHPDLVKNIYCMLHLNSFSRLTSRGISMIDRIRNILPRPSDHRLEVYFIAELFLSSDYLPLSSEMALPQALEHFKHFDDSDVKCIFYD
jgi:hypothetical protein